MRPGTSPGPLPDEGEAGGSRRALEGRVGIAETALDVMGGLAGNRLLAYPGTYGQGTGGQETDEQEGPRADSHGQESTVERGARDRGQADFAPLLPFERATGKSPSRRAAFS